MLFAKNKVLRKYNMYPFWLSLPKTKIIWFFNLLTLSYLIKVIPETRHANYVWYFIFFCS